MARLQHPNIVQVYEVGEHDGCPYFALEFVDGGSLARRLGRRAAAGRATPPSWSETLARAVHHAHQRGVVHRDLKPANVLLASRDGHGRKVDRLRPGQAVIDSAWPAAGRPTPTHRARSWARPATWPPSRPARHDRASARARDVYALGAILYECLTGRPPFQGDDGRWTPSSRCVAASRSRRGGCSRRLPRDLETICLKCLQKEPQRRYAVGRGAGRRPAAGSCAGEPIRARPTSAWERMAKWVKRRPTVAGLLTALIVGVVVGVAVVVLALAESGDRPGGRGPAPPTGRAQLAKLIAVSHRDWLAGDLAQARQGLAECPPEYRDRQWHTLDRACRAERFVNRRHLGCTMVSVAFHPDGRTVATLDATGRLAVWDTTDGREAFVIQGTIGQFHAVRFRPDGSELRLARPSRRSRTRGRASAWKCVSSTRSGATRSAASPFRVCSPASP